MAEIKLESIQKKIKEKEDKIEQIKAALYNTVGELTVLKEIEEELSK